MSYLTDEKFDSKKRAKVLLEEMKKKEQTMTFHAKRISGTTIVYCKNKERIEEFENNYNNISNW